MISDAEQTAPEISKLLQVKGPLAQLPIGANHVLPSPKADWHRAGWCQITESKPGSWCCPGDGWNTPTPGQPNAAFSLARAGLAAEAAEAAEQLPGPELGPEEAAQAGHRPPEAQRGR